MGIRIKTKNKDFELFQKEFTKWQQKFGLTGYQVYFKHAPLDKAFANIIVKQRSMVATVTLNSEIDEDGKPFKDIKNSAKHEALHLLVARLEGNGHYRYSTEVEIYEAAEELVIRLQSLVGE
uniref:Peptidase n=1 Tax=viral metagenome TaxID=1070528 RepID=A0A6H1ZG65_9ZZZZ